MKEMDTANDKIKKICDEIKTQTIEPAKQQAKEIVENARMEAKAIKAKAEDERQEVLCQTERELFQKQTLCLASIKSASKQIIDQLKHEIENEFFNKNLKDMIIKASLDPSLISRLITAVVVGVEKEGIEGDLSVFVAKEAGADKISLLLAADIMEKLKEKRVLEGNFSGGVKIRLLNERITVDISDEALVELLSRYIRKEFRDLIFTF